MRTIYSCIYMCIETEVAHTALLLCNRRHWLLLQCIGEMATQFIFKKEKQKTTSKVYGAQNYIIIELDATTNNKKQQ